MYPRNKSQVKNHYLEMGGLLDTSPIVSYSLSISKLDALEAHLSGGSLESWVENVRFKPFAPEREAGNQEFPPVRHSTEREVGGESVFPVHFKVGFFSFSWCVSISQCFWISFRGNCSLVAVDSVYSLEMSSGISYLAILNQNLKLLLTFRNGRKWVVRVWKCH